MNKLMALVTWLVVTCTACGANPSAGPDVYDIYAEMGQGLSSDFYVRINLKVRAEEIKTYPQTWNAVLAALATWAAQVPVHFIVHVQDGVTTTQVMRESISIRLIDLQAPPYRKPTGLLGLWVQTPPIIFLDADMLEDGPVAAVSVVLHELGHMLGVPHVINWNEPGLTGFIVLPRGEDASASVMYPRAIPGKDQINLSEIEVAIARHTLIHVWTRPSGENRHADDCEILLDNED